MRARLLLDSELLVWALAAPARLPRELRERLDAAEVYVSAASVLEVGLVLADAALAAEVLAALEPSGFRTLAVSAEHAALAAGLPDGGADPVDRLLIAQASAEGMTLVTTDPALAAAPVRAAAGRAPTARRRHGRGARIARRTREAYPPRCPVILATAATQRRKARG
ncbi:MAG TPA: type II toxin-antitoxin system VapC family toxin [Steroidobacteraceae bacterium]|nr:type II toxin-antitoxin system VapC family toxin [Steroidobacteraceae bacterium]